MLLRCDFDVYLVSEEKLKEEFNITFKGEGWVQDGRKGKTPDTALIVKEGTGLRIYVWANYDPRPALQELVAFPFNGKGIVDGKGVV